MRDDLWKPIKTAHPNYWSDKIRLMPDGYSSAIVGLFRDVEQISGGLQLVEIDLLAYPGGGIAASMRPRTDGDDVTDAQKAQLFDLLKSWSKAVGQICQVCGRSPVSILKYMDSRDQEILCEQHMRERRSSDE